MRDALGPDGRVRVDANGAWDGRRGGHRAIALLDRAAGGLEYVEQPCASVEDLAAVRRRVDVPIAADESIRRAEDPYRVRDLEAADVAVLKVQPLGGVRACLRIAEDIGLPVVVSQRAGDQRRHRRRGRARGGAARAAVRLRPGHRAAAERRRGPPTRCCRWTARCPSTGPRWTRRGSRRRAAAPDRAGALARRGWREIRQDHAP